MSGVPGRLHAHPVGGVLLFAALALAVAPSAAGAQFLADFDYEDLTFRGIGFEAGYIFPDRVEDTHTLGFRADLGFLGPGVRMVAGLTHWSSFLIEEEVSRLEERVEELVFEQTEEEVPVDLGTIEWSDVVIRADAHMMWRVPFGVLTYTGLGASAHVMRGQGRAVEDTFVQDLLTSVRAGLNAHAGLEVPLHRRFRLVGEGRYELLENLRYGQLRVGGQFMFRGWLPAEEG